MVDHYRPVLAPGCTVMLCAQKERRRGMYLAGLKEYFPYRVLSMQGEWLTLLTQDGPRQFLIHCFDPVSCKYAMFEKVRVWSSKRKMFSTAMTIRGYSTREGYLLSNGCYFDISVLKPPSECIIGFETGKTEKITEQTLNF